MTITATVRHPADTLDELAAAIRRAKGDDLLAPVTVIVPTNTCGVMTRRALGGRHGLVGVDFVTLNRLAELIAGPTLAAQGRSPMSSSLLEVAIGRILHERPGSFGVVATHPSTVVALRTLHEELRLAGAEALDRLHGSSKRGYEAVRVSRAVTEQLCLAWYDEADLFELATSLIGAGTDAGDGGDAPAVFRGMPAPIIVHLPQALPPVACRFVRRLGESVDVHVISDVVDQPACAALRIDQLAAFGLSDIGSVPSPTIDPDRRVTIISTTDADDEVRIAIRTVLEAARTGVPFERIALLWPTQRPYARLVEHHLTAAAIPFNGRPGTTVTERLAPRLILDLLDVDRAGLRRRALFSLIADVPPVSADGSFLPTASWERVSREAGVARDDDWQVRLGALTHSVRWGDAATGLLDFVGELRATLEDPGALRPWSHWAAWCGTQLERWVGIQRLERLPEIEFRAWEALTKAIDRLSHLDPVGVPINRQQFRSALEAELDAMPGRVGRVGDGVTVGSLASAVGLDVDTVIVLGAAEGSLPPRPDADALLSEADRASAGLLSSDHRIVRMHHLLLALSETTELTFTWPRGDLRATSHVEPSRWLSRWVTNCDTRAVASYTAGLASTEFPASQAEHRLRARLAHIRSGATLADVGGLADDPALARGLAHVDGRASSALTVYDGDLSGVGVPRLEGIVSPTQLETWTSRPHAYFLRYLLHVQPVEDPVDQVSITALDKGSTHHQALDAFHRAVISGELPQPGLDGWTTRHRDALMEYFDDECARAERRGRTGRRAFWSDARERMRADLLGWLEHDSEVSRRRGSTVVASEHRFGALTNGASDAADDSTVPVALELADGRQIRLHGSVDRIDVTAEGSVVVTDHKSGKGTKYRKLDASDPTLGGTVFQLPAYAAAARALLGRPDTLVRTEYSLLGDGNYERRGYELTGDVADAVSEQLTRIVSGIESGYFPCIPDRPGWRGGWINDPYSEPDGLGTSVRWAEWIRKRRDPRLATWFAAADQTNPIGDPVADAQLDRSTDTVTR